MVKHFESKECELFNQPQFEFVDTIFQVHQAATDSMLYVLHFLNNLLVNLQCYLDLYPGDQSEPMNTYTKNCKSHAFEKNERGKC